MPKWRPMKTAPRDGTPVLILADGDYWPFIGCWGRAGRFTDTIDAWIGHENGYHLDRHLTGWRTLPHG